MDDNLAVRTAAEKYVLDTRRLVDCDLCVPLLLSTWGRMIQFQDTPSSTAGAQVAHRHLETFLSNDPLALLIF
jgi:hypothetical protein